MKKKKAKDELERMRTDEAKRKKKEALLQKKAAEEARMAPRIGIR
jgi:hypothetical protein